MKLWLKILCILIVIFIIFKIFISPSSWFTFYNREDITAIAIKFNVPRLCSFVPPSDNCGTELPCAKKYLCYNAVALSNNNSNF
ncbi:MAG: hypothetical protein HY219_00385 [Candidatus Staskawiczbacteria bacterium]|nr:hypothetical protein [Candidatus Staskawiczbacteria bacterium]